MDITPVRRRTALSDAQKSLAGRIWVYADRLNTGVEAVPDDDGVTRAAVIHDTDAALSRMWPDPYNTRQHVPPGEECMYLLPTVTTGNFNLAALDAARALARLMEEYKSKYWVLFSSHYRDILETVENLEAWHRRVVDKRDDLRRARIAVPLGGFDEDVWGMVEEQIAESIPLLTQSEFQEWVIGNWMRLQEASVSAR